MLSFSSISDWYDENEHVPIMLGWIKRFSMFAVVVRPKSKEISVPSAGLIWRPVEDGRISLQFPSGCFQNDNTNCTVKVPTLTPYLSCIVLHT